MTDEKIGPFDDEPEVMITCEFGDFKQLGRRSEAVNILRAHHVKAHSDLLADNPPEAVEEAMYDNLNRGVAISEAIDRLKNLQRKLKDAFAHRALDGGAPAAVEHPLYLLAQSEIEDLEESLTQLI